MSRPTTGGSALHDQGAGGFASDLRRLLREGSAEDLAVTTSWDPAIRKQASHVTAYSEQVCVEADRAPERGPFAPGDGVK